MAVALIVISALNVNGSPQSLSYSQFEKELLGRRGVERITIVRNDLKAEVTIMADSIENYKSLIKSDIPLSRKGPHFIVDLPSVDSFEESRKAVEKEEGRNIPVFYEQRSNVISDMLMFAWPILLIVALYYFMFRRMSGGSGGGIFGVGNSKAKEVGKDTMVNVSFKDVAGLDGAKQELEEKWEFLLAKKSLRARQVY